MKVIETELSGVVILETTVFEDKRGIFSRLYNIEELRDIMGERNIHQVNLSLTKSPGTVRGMHYQYPPYSEMKLVKCLRGRAWNVVVDLRQNSSTFLQHHAFELSSHNALMHITPEGCAHGFQTLEPDTELLYIHTALYKSDCEGGVSCNDPKLAINWPLPITNLSLRDSSFAPITDDFKGIAV